MIINFFGKAVCEITKQSSYRIATYPISNNFSFPQGHMIDLVLADEVPQLNTKFLADPFIFTYNEKSFVFFEGLDVKAKKGAKGFIGVIGLDKNGHFMRETAKRIIQQPFHLSYPQVFSYKGRIFMAPDTSRTNEMKIWVAENFPYEWSYYGSVSTGALLDCTIFNGSEGEMYLVGGSKKDFTTRLFVLNFDTLDISEHPSSPLDVDGRLFRPAGNIVNMSNTIYRPVQEYTAYYGERTHIFEIELLDKSKYKEVYVNSIEKMKWNSYQSHHISTCAKSNLAVLDGSKKNIDFRLGFLKISIPIA